MKHPTKLLEWAVDDDIAELVAGVRRETIEECAQVALAYAEAIQIEIKQRVSVGLKTHLAELSKVQAGTIVASRIRALLDEPETEPRCRVCGRDRSGCRACGQNPTFDWPDAFEPEEPGHG